jgi:colicin import membrane protein
VKSGTRFKTGVTVSAVGHVAVLGWGLISFTVKPHEPKYEETLVVDVISDSALNQATAGQRNAKQAEQPKQKVEKIAEAKPVENEATKIVENKPEIEAAVDEPKPKPPEPEKKPEPKKPEPPKEAKVEPPKPEAKPEPKPEPKVDQIAEALKKEEPKKKPEPPKPEPKPQVKKEEPKKPERKYDPADISKRLALIDKREPQRRAATGDTLSQTASLGLPTASAPVLTMNELAALRARLQECWTVPVGVADARDLQIQVRIQFRKDGSLAAEPALLNRGHHPAFQVAAESALRAVKKCAPYSFMPVAKYEAWKDVEVTFDPRDMFRG